MRTNQPNLRPEILRYGNPILFTPAEPFDLPNELPLARKIYEQMIAATTDIGAVGIAAPQIGISKRIVMFEVPAVHERYKTDGIAIPLRVMINPKYRPLREDKNLEWEACLSVPGMMGRVARYNYIEYCYTDLDGIQHLETALDFHARVIQHELDHLDGVLYPMLIEDMHYFGYKEDVIASSVFLESRR